MRLIDADRLKEVFHRNVASVDAFDQLIDIQPTVEQRPKGHWILVDKTKNRWKCTHCIELGKDDWWQLNSGTPEDNKMDFCPHCGAIMREVEE